MGWTGVQGMSESFTKCTVYHVKQLMNRSEKKVLPGRYISTLCFVLICYVLFRNIRPSMINQ